MEVNPGLCRNEWKTILDLSSWSDLGTLSHYYPLKRFRIPVLRNHFLMPWFQHRSELQERYLREQQHGRGNLQISAHGWLLLGGETVGEDDRLRLTENERQLWVPVLSDDFEVSANAKRAYRDLLSLCHSERIEVALILMPQGETARSWACPAVNEVMDTFLGELADEYRVPVFDTRDWFDDSYFCDSSHFLRPGSRRFTRRLEREILQPWIHTRNNTRVTEISARSRD